MRQAKRRHRRQQTGVGVLSGGHGPIRRCPRQPGLPDPAQHHRGRLVHLGTQHPDRDRIPTRVRPDGGLHAADQSGQHPASLVVAGRLVGTVRSFHAKPEPGNIWWAPGGVSAYDRFQTVIGHHGPLDLTGRRVTGLEPIGRLFSGQFCNLNPQDLCKGGEHAVTVHLSQAALDLRQPAFRAANQPGER
jgi:hypothetical protein